MINILRLIDAWRLRSYKSFLRRSVVTIDQCQCLPYSVTGSDFANRTRSSYK